MVDYNQAVEEAINSVFRATEQDHPLNSDLNKRREYYNRNMANRPQLLKRIIDECHIDGRGEGYRILDIGPAEGIIARALSNLGYDVTVLEHKLCCVGADKVAYYFPLNFAECVLQEGMFPFKDNFFNCVISTGVIEHIEPPTKKFWKEIFRVMAPGGMGFIENPNPHNLRKRFFKLFAMDENEEINAWFGQEPIFTSHFREHSFKELIYSAEKTGFTIVNASSINFISLGRIAITQSLIRKYLYKLYQCITSRINNMNDTIYIVIRK